MHCSFGSNKDSSTVIVGAYNHLSAKQANLFSAYCCCHPSSFSAAAAEEGEWHCLH